MTDLSDLLEQLDLVVARGEGHVARSDLESAAQAAAAARERTGAMGATLVVALLGGTGVGKSSLLNAIAGEAIASTSRLRPHTTSPLAWVPQGAEPSLGSVLDGVGVVDRVTQDRMKGLAVIDMTDVDSVEGDHLARVRESLPSIDAQLWVVDPEKYADLEDHRDLVASEGLGGRIAVVLNRIDVLDADQHAAVLEDLQHVLEGLGLGEAPVFSTAADPAEGPPLGIDAVVAHLGERLDEKRLRLARVVEEARSVVRRLASASGVNDGAATGFDDDWRRIEAYTAECAARGATPADREELTLGLSLLVGEVAGRSGSVTGAGIREAFPRQRLADVVDAALQEARLDGGGVDGDALLARLVDEIARPIREMLWERAVFAATITGFGVAAASARQRIERAGLGSTTSSPSADGEMATRDTGPSTSPSASA